MPGLIEELSTLASDQNQPVSQLLRRMKVAAVRLHLGEPEAWVDHELTGYADDDPLPNYRFVWGIPQSFHFHWGWRNLKLSDNTTNNLLMSHVQYRSGIDGLETMAHGKDALRLSYPRFIEEAVLPWMPHGVNKIGLFVDRASIASAIAGVRDKILDWSLAMERAGVRGEGLSFTTEERREAQNVSYNFHMNGENNRANIGSMDNSTNTVVRGSLFSDLRTSIESEVEDESERAAILAMVSQMEEQRGKKGFVAAYGRFMQAAANHIQVIQPFLGPLGDLISGH